MYLTKYEFMVIGGDMRQVYLADVFSQMGYRVCHYALPEMPSYTDTEPSPSLKAGLSSADTIIAPVPLTKNGITLNHQTEIPGITLSLIADSLQKGQNFFAGCIPDFFMNLLYDKGIVSADLMKSPELAVYNSIATAEGAISEAISKSSRNLRHSKCLVLGYGTCAKTLSDCLKGLSCKVTIAARNPIARAEAAITADSVLSLQELDSSLSEFDYIFNTIPKEILYRARLKKMKKDVLIIDIASAPGGIDYEAAHELGISAYLCPGLPGRYAPLSSSEAIARTVLEQLTQNRKKE